MTIRFFKNERGQFREVTSSTGLDSNEGFWRSMVAADVDGDGDDDLIAGNLGLNTEYKTTVTEPARLFTGDMDGNGSIDPVMFYYINQGNKHRGSFPAISRGAFAMQVPSIKKQFLLNKDYGLATDADIFKDKATDNALWLTCRETATCYFENLGNGKFRKHLLPVEAQFAPVNAIICDDLDGDGRKDLLLAGNEYQAEVMAGRYDASYGLFLKGDGRGQFHVIKTKESGFMVKGDVKDMALLRVTGGERRVLVAVNNDTLRVFKVNH
jgi:hypothetical protein